MWEDTSFSVLSSPFALGLQANDYQGRQSQNTKRWL